LKLAIRYHSLFTQAERQPWQLALIICAFATFVVLAVLSLLHRGLPTVQFIEVAWTAIAAYGLTFDILNVLNVHHDRVEAAELETNGFSGVYWDSQVTYAKKRLVSLMMTFTIGVGSMFLHPSDPDSESASFFFALFFFVIGYCIASNAQDSWLYRRMLAEQLRAPLHPDEPEAMVASVADTPEATREEDA
jgi:hypothetical protein